MNPIPLRAAQALALAFLLLPRPGTAEPLSLTIATHWPPGSRAAGDLRTAARQIARRTDQRVRVRFVEADGLEADGRAVDGAMLAGPELARRSLSSRVFSLPLLLRSADEAVHLRDRLAPAVARELRDAGLEPIGPLDVRFAYLHSRTPLHTVEDFAAARLWMPPVSTGPSPLGDAASLNLVSRPTAGVRDGLREGDLDAVIAPPLVVILLQWHPHIRHVARPPFLAIATAVVLRPDALALLDEADRVVVRTTLADAFETAFRNLNETEPEAFEVLEAHGVALQNLGRSTEERAAWQAWAETLAGRLVEDGRLASDTVQDARAAIEAFRNRPAER